MLKVGVRMALALLLAGTAAGCLYWYAVMPYEIISTTTTSTYVRAVPSGEGYVIAAAVMVVAALVAAFSGDWE